MNTTASRNSTLDDSLTTEIGLSLGLHLIVAVLVVFKFVVFPSEPLVMNRAIRVDIVDLPDKLPQTGAPAKTKAVETAPKPVAVTPSKAEPAPTLAPHKIETAPKIDKKAQSSALERIRALQEIENQVHAEEQKGARKPVTYKGQVLNPGTNLTGIDKLQHDSYLGDLDSHVKEAWILPQWLKNANLKARVLVKLDANGNVIHRQITQSSNNPMYDEKVVEAIDRASPFPKPPDKFVRILEVSGVEFGFPE